MMQRRRNLLHCLANQGGSDIPAYITNQLTYQLITTGNSAAASTVWYYGADFTFDASTGLFTLSSPTSIIISYASARMFRTKVILGNYCIKGSSSGSAMYLMPADGTITVAASGGVYTSQVNGNVTEYLTTA